MRSINIKRNRNKKIAILILALLCIVSISVLSLFIHRDTEIENNEEEIITVIDEEKDTVSVDPDLEKMWKENKKINEDYLGQIIFDSGLINLPFVQARDVYKDDGELHVFYDENGNQIKDPSGYTGNDVYIWTNWKSGKYDRYEEGGSTFMDYRNSLDDQNLIIYGHHFARDFDPSGSKQFTPLDVLLDKDNYDSNKSLKLILDHEIRSYVVSNVFTMDIYDERQVQILRTDMDTDLYGNEDQGFFQEYIGYINSISKYDTKQLLNEDDHLLTLVTCLQHQPRYRQIILCRQTGIERYE